MTTLGIRQASLSKGCVPFPAVPSLADQTPCRPGFDHAGGDVRHGHHPTLPLVETTVTWQDTDLNRAPDAVVGDLTLFHWIRMLTSNIGRILTYTPLLHSLTISLGTVVLSFLIGGSLAWLVVRTDMPGGM